MWQLDNEGWGSVSVLEGGREALRVDSAVLFWFYLSCSLSYALKPRADRAAHRITQGDNFEHVNKSSRAGEIRTSTILQLQPAIV